MRLKQQKLSGIYSIDMETVEDRQKLLSKPQFTSELHQLGIGSTLTRTTVFSHLKRGVLRGLHCHRHPHRTDNLVRVTRGSAYLVFVDLRPNSGTYLKWHGIQLDPYKTQMIYTTTGFASGFIVMDSGTEVVHQCSALVPQKAVMRMQFDDPLLGIHWPEVGPLFASESDRALPLYQPAVAA